MEGKIKETAEKLTERLNGDQVEKIKPVANTIAEMIVRCNWESERFKFKQEFGNLALVIDGKDSFTAYLSGYNYAYQIKLCLAVIAAAGLFE